MPRVARKARKSVQAKPGRQTRHNPAQLRSDDDEPNSQQLGAFSSQGSSKLGANPDFATVTAEIGGEDIDRGRPTKLARISPTDFSDEDAIPVHDTMSGTNGVEALHRDKSEESFQSVEEPVLYDIDPRGDEDDLDDAISEVAKETIEAEVANQIPVHRGLAKIKRPKGWHLRKENRHLRRNLLQESPVRSERQDSLDTQEINGHEPAAILRRLPGRRRAPHADAGIEAAMRRQLELKIAYRAVAKTLKPVLIELAARTETDLDSDPHLHQAFEAYNDIAEKLEKELEARLNIIEDRRVNEEERLKKNYEDHREGAECRRLVDAEDALDDALIQCQSHFMTLLRESTCAQDKDATDDESEADALPPTHWDTYKHRDDLKIASHSRCAWYRRTEERFDHLEKRHKFFNHQRKYDRASLDPCPRGFTVFDGRLRQEAQAKINLLTLLEADDEIKAANSSTSKALRDEDTPGLQALVSAVDIRDCKHENKHSMTLKSTIYDPIRQVPPPSQPDYMPPVHDTRTYTRHPFVTHAGAEPRLGSAPPMKYEDGYSRYPVEPPYLPPRAAEPPTLEIVGPVPSPLHARGRDAMSNARNPEDSRHRRKALTFDIIMHQPDVSLQDSKPASMLAVDRDFRRPRESAVSVPTNADDRTQFYNDRQNTGFVQAALETRWRHKPAEGRTQIHSSPVTQASPYPPHPTSASAAQSRTQGDASTISKSSEDATEPTEYRRWHHNWNNNDDHSAPHESSPQNYPHMDARIAEYWKGSPKPNDGADFNDTSRSYPATPASSNGKVTATMTAEDTAQPYHHSLASKPPVTSPSTNFSKRGSHSRPVSPTPAVGATAKNLFTYSSRPRETPPRLNEAMMSDTHYQDRKGRGTHARNQQHFYDPVNASPRTNYSYHRTERYPPHHEINKGFHNSPLAVDRPQTETLSQFQHPQAVYQPIQPSQGQEESMQRHPGQRIGHQLLPSTLDPKKNQASTTTSRAVRHRKHRSSSGSTRSWTITMPAQQPSPATYQWRPDRSRQLDYPMSTPSRLQHSPAPPQVPAYGPVNTATSQQTGVAQLPLSDFPTGLRSPWKETEYPPHPAEADSSASRPESRRLKGHSR